MANGTLKVGTITTSSGSGTITIGQSGETIAGIATNTPSFFAYLGGSGGQSISDNTITKITIDTELFDSGGCFNNTSGSVSLNGITTPSYAFAPNVAGKYLVFGAIQYEAGSNTELQEDYLYFKVNGSNYYESQNDFQANNIRLNILHGSILADLNGTSDYIEIYARMGTSGSTQLLESDTQYKKATHFGAYKIIGA
jgi:hypothetical protein